MPTPGRQANTGDYRYGFNGQEKDDEFSGKYAFEYRIHDPRIGRFLSVDPLDAEYPWNSTYSFAENKVIAAKDLEGREIFVSTYLVLRELSPEHKKYTDRLAKGAVDHLVDQIMGLYQTMESFTPPTPTSLNDLTLATAGTSKNMVKWDEYLAKMQGIDGAAMVQNMIAQYKDLFYRASEGEPEAIGALAVELGLGFIPFDEARYLKFAKALRTNGNILDDVTLVFSREVVHPEFLDDFARMGTEQVAPLPKQILPRKVGNLKGGPLENATQVNGRFTMIGGPRNGTVYRADNAGNITSYATYDAYGMIIKRVDVSGPPHNGVNTPHVLDYGRNVRPDGTVEVQSKGLGDPRPATSGEIP